MGEAVRSCVEERVLVPGAQLWAVSKGAGVPLVLNHGGPGLSDNLGPVAAMVDDLARVHRYDQRGAGRSQSEGPFDVASFVADLEVLREHWGHERWVVGGHSWGANLALFYALHYPERTLGVIYLSGTGLQWGWQDSARRRRLARLSPDEQTELRELELALADGDTTGQQRFLQLMWLTDLADRSNAHVFDEHPLYRFPRNDRVFREASISYKAKLDAGAAHAAAQLDVPLLVMHGAQDNDPARAQQVAQTARRGRWVELPDAAHSPWLEQPDAMRDSLRNFLHDLT